MTLQRPIPSGVDVDAVMVMFGVPSSSSASRPLRDEITPAHQVVGGGAKAKQPIHEASATVAQLAEEGDGLQPAERLLNQLPLAMTDAIPGVSGGARVDRTAAVPEFVLGHMGRNAHPSNGGDPGARVVRLVRAHRDAA